MSKDITSMQGDEKAKQVRSLFNNIAPHYDLLNHLCSINIDKRWRRFTVEKLADVLAQPNANALDVCCGTADLSIELAKKVSTVGVDFSHPMLVIGNQKVKNYPIVLLEGDAMKLPFTDNSFNALTCAFGLRNLSDTFLGLAEFYRLLKPGGRVAILELSHPVVPIFREVFLFYFNRLLPLIGGLISGSLTAYSYLPASVAKFPDQKRLAKMMEDVGYKNVHYFNLTGGTAALHLGDKT
jgi:demethylmenaquinone methyltransferase / 2-methoxy-6-polyprenyl-1,4-benzoquinol methylase